MKTRHDAGAWRDDPIVSSTQDRLGRASYAGHVAALIDENHSAESSVVYGLEGPWGSGKTSLIALITASLRAPGRQSWHVIPFTPWATNGTESLMQEFFAALSTASPKGRTDKLMGKLQSYSGVTRPLMAVIPVVGGALVEVSRSAEDAIRKPWNVAFQEVADAIRQLETPILLVVDDIDRLQPLELLDLLKVVRLLGRFPGVDFLLAYDDQTLVDTLQNPTRGRVSAARARAFMEKIVQYPLSIPPILHSKVISMVSDGLTEILSPERVESDFEAQRFSRVLMHTMPSQLGTPRAVERFLAQVRMQFALHDRAEINDVDLVLATFVRVQFPDVFAQLQRWRSELTRSSASFGLPRKDEVEPNWSALLGSLEDIRDQADAREAMGVLFPAMLGRSTSRAAPGRFANPEYFDRYLVQAIPEGDIPDYAITTALRRAAAGDGEQLHSLLLQSDEDRVTLALSKISAQYHDADDARTSTPPDLLSIELLAEGMRVVALLEERIVSWSSNLSTTTYWLGNVIRLLLSRDPQVDIHAGLAACTDLRRRSQVTSAALKGTDTLSPAAQDALRLMLDVQAQLMQENLLEDLRSRDSARQGPGPGPLSLYLLVREAGQAPAMKAKIEAGLRAREYTLADVASRFVSFSYIVGGPPEPSSASFAGGLFTEFTGIEAGTGDMDERGQWQNADWSRRRAYAAQYVPALQEKDGDADSAGER